VREVACRRRWPVGHGPLVGDDSRVGREDRPEEVLTPSPPLSFWPCFGGAFVLCRGSRGPRLGGEGARAPGGRPVKGRDRPPVGGVSGGRSRAAGTSGRRPTGRARAGTCR